MPELGDRWDYGQGKSRRQEHDDSAKMLAYVLLGSIVAIGLGLALYIWVF